MIFSDRIMEESVFGNGYSGFENILRSCEMLEKRVMVLCMYLLRDLQGS